MAQQFNIENYIVNTLHMSPEYLEIQDTENTSLYDFVLIAFTKCQYLLDKLYRLKSSEKENWRDLTTKEQKYLFESGMLTTAQWLLQNKEQKEKDLLDAWNTHLYLDRQPQDLSDLQLRMSDVSKTIEDMKIEIDLFQDRNTFLEKLLKKSHLPAIGMYSYKRNGNLSIHQIAYKLKNMLDNKEKLKKKYYKNYLYHEMSKDIFFLVNFQQENRHLYPIFISFYKDEKYHKDMINFIDKLLLDIHLNREHVLTFISYIYEHGYEFTPKQIEDINEDWPQVLVEINRINDERRAGIVAKLDPYLIPDVANLVGEFM